MLYSNNINKMLVYYIMIKEKITENKKEYYKNYRLKNRDKLNAYQRQKYYERKNKIKEKNEDIKKDIEKLKEKFRLLYVDHEDLNINILIIVTR